MQLIETLDNALREAIESMGYVLWGIEILQSPKGMTIRIYIDHKDGISVDDCQAVSHQVSGILDVEDVIIDQYTLEVSSPGADRRLFSLEQVQCFEGFEVKGRFKDLIEGYRKFQKAELKKVDQSQLTLAFDDKLVDVDFDQIEWIRIAPKF